MVTQLLPQTAARDYAECSRGELAFGSVEMGSIAEASAKHIVILDAVGAALRRQRDGLSWKCRKCH
jgi:hypothetical protein